MDILKNWLQKIKPVLNFIMKHWFFSQRGGLQQIIIVHEEGDKYATEISDKILNSIVEL
jgi:hypothetical protein